MNYLLSTKNLLKPGDTVVVLSLNGDKTVSVVQDGLKSIYPGAVETDLYGFRVKKMKTDWEQFMFRRWMNLSVEDRELELNWKWYQKEYS